MSDVATTTTTTTTAASAGGSEEARQLNAKWMVCRLCGCKVLRPGKAWRERRHFKLRDKAGGEGEFVDEYWTVDDMWEFENIGFAKTIKLDEAEGGGEVSFLCCADCEAETIGFHVKTEEPKRFYVACDRVQEKDSV